MTQTSSDPRWNETHSNHDHKKILKIFFRWMKIGNRSKNEVSDTTEFWFNPDLYLAGGYAYKCIYHVGEVATIFVR